MDTELQARIEAATSAVEKSRQAVEAAEEEARVLREHRDALTQELSKLKARAASVPRMRRYIDAYLYRRDSGCTFQELGDRLGVTRERARQICLKGERIAGYYVRREPHELTNLGYSTSDFLEFARAP